MIEGVLIQKEKNNFKENIQSELKLTEINSSIDKDSIIFILENYGSKDLKEFKSDLKDFCSV